MIRRVRIHVALAFVVFAGAIYLPAGIAAQPQGARSVLQTCGTAVVLACNDSDEDGKNDTCCTIDAETAEICSCKNVG